MTIIKNDNSNLKTLVINLDDYIKNFEIQKPYLDNLNLNVERFSGINAIKNQHIDYKSNISIFAKYFTPKPIIGCALSHILCCKYIYENYIDKYDFFLIMEDDAFPLYNKKDFFEILNNTINDINILDKNWEIIQLHSDAFFPTTNTYSAHIVCGSTAAYLISKKGIEKTLNEKVLSHADFIQHNFIKYNKYRVKQNLFYTNEKDSLNRIAGKKKYDYYTISLYLKSKLLEKFNNHIISLPLRGEKTYSNFLEFKLLKIPYLEKEYTANEIIDYIIAFYIFKKILK
jgi:GR25 family glycosyltransferase involved in LPS biosynthesis